jgi:hypothetical protein
MGGTCRTHKGEMINVFRSVVGKPKGKRSLEISDVNGRIILKWRLKKRRVSVWTRFNWLRIVSKGGFL